MRRNPVLIESVTFWLNAFIPGEVCLDKEKKESYTMLVPGEPDKTMFKAPPERLKPVFMPGFPGGIAPVPERFCYDTDYRTFNDDTNAKSRMHARVKILSNRPADAWGRTCKMLDPDYRCDPTVQRHCETGAKRDTPRAASTRRMKYRLSARTTGNNARVDFVLPAAHPFTYAAAMFGDIDVQGFFHIDYKARSLSLDCKIDSFPAFEAYASINDGKATNLFMIDVPTGNTVTSLPGEATRQVRRRICDSSGNGAFDDSCRYEN